MVKKFKRVIESESEDEEYEQQEEEIIEKELINDIETIEKKITNIKSDYLKLFKGKNPNWLELPEITNEQMIDQQMNVDDDIKRELSFYNMTFLNAVDGINHLKKVNKEIFILVKRTFK
jgi:hypothetical protein